MIKNSPNPRKKIFLFAIFWGILATAPAYAWVENGQICYRHGKHSIKSCRDPKDAADLQREIAKEKATNVSIALSNKFDSCKFSLLRDWSSEISRLKKQIDNEKSLQSFANKEKYWATEDIRKSEVLPSETVRAAYDAASTFGDMANDSQRKIYLYSWCIQCASKKPSSYEDCQ